MVQRGSGSDSQSVVTALVSKEGRILQSWQDHVESESGVLSVVVVDVGPGNYLL